MGGAAGRGLFPCATAPMGKSVGCGGSEDEVVARELVHPDAVQHQGVGVERQDRQ
jgi:hypothetical protein